MPRPLDDDYPLLPADRITALTVAQMRQVDRTMEEDLGIDLARMMENAGRHLATLVRTRFLGGRSPSGGVDVLAGAGGNGGGALVAARRLAGWGVPVRVWLTHPAERLKAVVAQQANILRAMSVTMSVGCPTLPAQAVVVDGLVGYGLDGSLRGTAVACAGWVGSQSVPIVALDVPSGLDSDTGEAPGPVVSATATLTLARPKTGLLVPRSRRRVGQLYLADIGVPEWLYARLLGIPEHAPVFARGDLVRLAL